MAYTVPNHTQTPNELFDEHMKLMNGSELKIVLAICRKTFGWHKEQDQISLSQMMEMTGLKRPAVIAGIQSAMSRGIVARRQIGRSFEYALILTDGKKILPSDSNKKIPSVKGGNGKKMLHTKEKKRNTLLIKEIKDYTDDVFANFIEN